MTAINRDVTDWDVIVVGGGNAALCAALSARESGAESVLVLERAPKEERGGNSRFTAGTIRFAFETLDDIVQLIPDLTPEELERYDFGTYPADQYYEDMLRVTHYRTDAELANVLVSESYAAMQWLRDRGIRFIPNGRQAFMVNGKLRFWGGLVLDAVGGGPGLVDGLYDAASREGIAVWYGARAVDLVRDCRGVHGVHVRRNDESIALGAKAVVLANGGFEANSEMRTRYMGPGWDAVKVRGTRFNTGDGIRMALEADAMSWGEWSGGHAVFWDQNSPAFGDLAVGDGFSKLSYPLGILINAHGERFIDEGADFRNYTYARYGREVLKQPGAFAWQVFDAKVLDLLRDEYRIKKATRIRAQTLESLVSQMEGVNAERALKTITTFNSAVRVEVPFDPSIKDGRCTDGLDPPKSNWANPLDQPPFEAFAVTCGITFTFGGVRIAPGNAQVLDTEERPIPGLFAAGELVGGIFFHNYPGGAGLASGAVFGRIAGRGATACARDG